MKLQPVLILGGADSSRIMIMTFDYGYFMKPIACKTLDSIYTERGLIWLRLEWLAVCFA